MRSIERRVVTLEGRGRSGDAHLTDEEVHARVVDLIGRFAEGGVVLPDDWRDRCAADAIGFLDWVEEQAEALL